MAETAIVTLLTNAWFLLPTLGYEQPLLRCNLFALLSVSVDFSVVENVNGPDTPCDSQSVETTLIPATDEGYLCSMESRSALAVSNNPNVAHSRTCLSSGQSQGPSRRLAPMYSPWNIHPDTRLCNYDPGQENPPFPIHGDHDSRSILGMRLQRPQVEQHLLL